jgi:hypothetical protein
MSNIIDSFEVYMRAKKKAPRTIIMVPIVIFGVMAELHKSPSQQTLAIIELALN